VKIPACLTALILVATFSGHTALADAPQSPLKAPPKPEWQLRRESLDHTINGWRQNDPEAITQFDQILTMMEKRPLDRTPMETLDVMGTYYVPNDGIQKCLTVIVTNLVLGWYDALRFGSSSGRAEIIDNEQFFLRALVLGGQDVTDKSIKFLTDHPDQVAQLVAQGIKQADGLRETQSYDRRWPSGYGLERILCASGDADKCQPQSLPKDQWDAAWAESKQAVTDYFEPKPATAKSR